MLDLGWLAGCAGTLDTIRAEEDIVTDAPAHPFTYPVQAADIHTPLPAEISLPTETLLVTAVRLSEVIPTWTVTPLPTLGAAFFICSPLQGDELDELHQIISDPYRPPPKGSDKRHHGVDFSYYRRKGCQSIQGTLIQSVLTGRVAARVMDSFPFGNLLMVETPADLLPSELANELGLGEGESLYIFYAHMESLSDLQIGDAVSACQPLGTVGKSGNAGAPHLHLETRLGPAGQVFASLSYYQLDNTSEERANYLLWRTSGLFRHFDPMQLLLYDLQPR